MESGVRIDKWLWCVRLFKTRTLATEACNGGKISINNVNVKPSKDIKIGDIINIHQKYITKTVKVTNLLNNRVGACLVPNYMEDLTTKEEYEKIEFAKLMDVEKRNKGTGRPTKKERREINKFKDLYY